MIMSIVTLIILILQTNLKPNYGKKMQKSECVCKKI